jgi:hypothetical protein
MRIMEVLTVHSYFCFVFVVITMQKFAVQPLYDLKRSCRIITERARIADGLQRRAGLQIDILGRLALEDTRNADTTLDHTTPYCVTPDAREKM